MVVKANLSNCELNIIVNVTEIMKQIFYTCSCTTVLIKIYLPTIKWSLKNNKKWFQWEKDNNKGIVLQK